MVDTKDTNEQILQTRERTRLANERNRLAAERTYLAWIRTGLGCVACGFGVARFLTFTNPLHELIAKGMGSLFALLGITIFILSYVDFQINYSDVSDQRRWTSSKIATTTLSFILIGVSLILIWLAWQA